MDTPKLKYCLFCQQNHSIPVFMQPWWLDIVCQKGTWNVCLVEEAGQIKGAVTYYQYRKWGFSFILQPPLTPFSGIWMAPQITLKLGKKYNFIKNILTKLIEQLPQPTFFQQQYHYTLTDWQPFYWRGFQQTTRYTYILSDIQNLTTVYQQFSENTKRNLAKAQKLNLQIACNDDFDSFYKINSLTFQRQGLKNPVPYHLFQQLNNELLQRKQRTIYFAQNLQGDFIATLFLVYDDQTAYYLAGGIDYQVPSNPGLFLLIWQAIQDASKSVPIFDFEGSMLPQIEPIFRGFGATQMPYSQIYKAKNRFWAAANQIFKKFG
jgi:hypothetical protein